MCHLNHSSAPNNDTFVSTAIAELLTGEDTVIVALRGGGGKGHGIIIS